MLDVSIKEARQNLKAFIDRVAAGEVVRIFRRGQEVARLVPPSASRRRSRAPSLEAFRRSITVKGKPMSLEVIKARGEERY